MTREGWAYMLPVLLAVLLAALLTGCCASPYWRNCAFEAYPSDATRMCRTALRYEAAHPEVHPPVGSVAIPCDRDNCGKEPNG